MERKEEIRALRIKKAAYPAQAVPHIPIGELRKRFVALTKAKKNITAVGRIVALRGHGGAVFMDIADASGKLQVLFRKDILGEKPFLEARDLLEAGDFISAQGPLFKTAQGEETLEAKKAFLLAKALLPPPTHFYGLKDTEERFRYRALDLLVNEEVRERFFQRSRIVDALRSEFLAAGFLEVETPVLQPIPGGASARPFTTHLNALDFELYLRVAPELYLKRLLVGGLERVFELGRAFRNEGMDATHNPEFTMLEAYWAYQDAEELLKFVETIFTNLVKEITGNTIVFRGKNIALKKPFSKISFAQALKKFASLDIMKANDSAVEKAAEIAGADMKAHPTRAEQLDAIFKKRCLEHFQNPTFVVEHPLELSPLAKAKDGKPAIADRFQLIVGGMEVVNAFSELNDPVEQRKRFEAQEKARKQGSEEAQRMDEEYLETMEYGMPPAAGLGIGVDRLVMLLTDAPSLREVILFPTMRPRS